MRLQASLCLSLTLGPGLAAQMPPGWNVQRPLGSDAEPGSPWVGAGFWSADQHGPPATLVDSVGLGNAITGTGFHLEAGLKAGAWDLAAETLGVRAPTGQEYLTLYRGHATWRSQADAGWKVGLEMEPLIWGYGLNGGYLLGDAGRPFPRFRVEAPMTPIRILGVNLGTWGGQFFMGRLENHPVLSSSLQLPLLQEARLKVNGTPEAPFLNGYRLQAAFSDFLELYANYTVLWGGTLNGKSMLAGYGAKDYLTAMLGAKDALAEAYVDPNIPGDTSSGYVNQARSAGNADVGLRMRSRPMERLLGAETVYGYVSRGSKNVWFNPGLALRNPPKYMWKDTDTFATQAAEFRYAGMWNESGRYTMPNLATPNDAVGVLLAWPRVRLGIEYLDAVNSYSPTAQGGTDSVRPFTHYIYLSGFYYYGDPLGNALGGEARTTTIRLETDWSERWSGTTLFHLGTSPFRDDPVLWQAIHPGATPAFDRFIGLQQAITWKPRPGLTLEAGGSWERHSAVQNVPGASADGFQWFSNLSFRWPSPR